MRILILVFVAFFAVSCEKKATYGFSSGDCNEVYTNCLNQCTRQGKPRGECVNSCTRSRGMCNSIKSKGCMQNCNKYHGRGSKQAENCKRQCAQ